MSTGTWDIAHLKANVRDARIEFATVEADLGGEHATIRSGLFPD